MAQAQCEVGDEAEVEAFQARYEPRQSFAGPHELL